MRGSFSVSQCRIDEDGEFPNYEFSPGRYATSRFENVLQIIIQEFSVDFVEGDALVIRMGDLEGLREREERPLVLPVSREQGAINAALSLFSTCPQRPTLRAISGELRFARLTLAEDPEDLGAQQIITGTLTATVVSADDEQVAGTIYSSFDFAPLQREPNAVQFP